MVGLGMTSSFRLDAGLACLISGQPRARLGEPASHVRVIHARPVGTASARSLSTGSSALIASVAAGEVRAVACLSAAICGSALMAAQPGIPRDRLHVRPGMDRL